MHSKTTPETPVTVATLSSQALYHLRVASPMSLVDEGIAAGALGPGVHEKLKSINEPKFVHFLQLPTELQAKIWGIFIAEQPRTVQLGSYMNEPNRLRQINQQIKLDCLSLHGFVDIDRFTRSNEEKNNNTVFHPDTDLLHLGPNSSWIWGPRSSTRRFAVCGALDKIRCVAVMKPKTQLAAKTEFESLREYKNLELVFVIIKVGTRASTAGWRETEWLKFRVVDDQEAAVFVRYRLYDTRPCKLISQAYRERLQEMMARGEERIAPRVVFVEEIRAWGVGAGADQ